MATCSTERSNKRPDDLATCDSIVAVAAKALHQRRRNSRYNFKTAVEITIKIATIKTDR
jgi:hypothetical protein